MDTINILGLLSGLIGIVGFFFPIEWKNKTVIKIVFVSVLSFLSIFIIRQNSKINRIEKISRSANVLIEKRATEFTSEGFILAALSFLEQNKQDFPDSYERAKAIFEKYDHEDFRNMNSVSVSYEMEGLIRGIAILATVNEN